MTVGPRALWRAIERRGLGGAAALALSFGTCYGTLAAVAALAALGVALAAPITDVRDIAHIAYGSPGKSERPGQGASGKLRVGPARYAATDSPRCGSDATSSYAGSVRKSANSSAATSRSRSLAASS